MSYEMISYTLEDTIGIVTINRPDKLNALNAQVLDELEALLDSEQHREEVRALIITGAGEKAFIAGADIKELHQLDMTAAKSFAERGQRLFTFIEHYPKPVIAAVNGYALGGGSELAMACHFRYASANAAFGQPEVNLGIIPGYGGTQRLTRLIGPGRAMEYILTGNNIKAEEAERIGLVNAVYEQNELLSKAKETAAAIAKKPMHAVRLGIKAVNAACTMTPEQGFEYESSLFAMLCGTEDFKEGTAAFLEKRKPEFKNR